MGKSSSLKTYTEVFFCLFVLSLGFFFFFSFFFCLFRAVPVAYGGSQAGVESELQLLAYTAATEMLDLSHIWDLHHSLWQHWILNPSREARD